MSAVPTIGNVSPAFLQYGRRYSEPPSGIPLATRDPDGEAAGGAGTATGYRISTCAGPREHARDLLCRFIGINFFDVAQQSHIQAMLICH